jgi:two-component system sensor histidine kinase BaeS
MKLKYQLFLALLTGGGILIILLAAIADWSFNRGFLDYVNRLERQRLAPLQTALVEGYQREGDWQWATRSNKHWRALIRETVRSHNRRERSPLDRSLLLADAQKKVLIGRGSDRPAVNWSPLTLQGQVIGYLGDLPLQRAPPGLDRVFAERQRRNFIFASLALLPLSALMAWILTKRIVRPLDTLNAAIARIGDGEFSERLPATRGDELGDLSRQVNRLAAALESNLQARQRWLAEISHELRTPVAVLQAELEAMQDGITPIDQDTLSSLHSETTRLTRLIDDLRDLTLSDAGALDYHIERLDLTTLVTQTLEQAHTRLNDAQLELTLRDQGPLMIDADAQRLSQLINNLLQNSLRYTDAGGSLDVSLERRDNEARLFWADSAPGVPASDLPRLFDPLFRVDASRRRASGGSGLGLAIVGKIAEAHGGRVSAEQSPLGGLAIELSVPLATDRAIETEST